MNLKESVSAVNDRRDGRKQRKAPVRVYELDPSVSISRNCGTGSFRFLDIFRGFELLDTVGSVFGEDTRKVLGGLRVEVFDRPGYMGVSDEDGHIFASGPYLREGEEWSIYLDVVHELVHVKQFMQGKELFDQSFSYADRPTEIEAYRVTVIEARRIGLSEDEIFEYLEVPWISKIERTRLAKACGVIASRSVEWSVRR